MKKKISKMSNAELQKLIDQACQLQKQNKWDECIVQWTKCISLQDDRHGQSELYVYRGIAYSGKGEYNWAMEDYSKAIELNIDNADAYFNRGLIYALNGRCDLAFPDFLCAGEKKKNLKSWHPAVYLAKRIKDIFGNGKKGVKSFNLFFALYTEILSIRFARFSHPKEGNEIAHYTSLDTLKKLAIKGECFRLYNTDYMSDPKEGRAFFDVMEQQKCGIGVESLFYPNNKETPRHSSAYIGSFVTVNPTVASANDQQHGKDESFFWGAYGEEAAGACLIFKHEKTHFAEHPPFEISTMSKLVDTGPMSWQQPPKPALYEMAYLSDCKKEGGKEELVVALGRLVEPLEGAVSLYNGSEANQKDALAKLVRELLDDIRFLFKADDYSKEHEVRVLKMDYYEAEQTGIHVDMEQPPHRLYRETPKDYRFHEVILGPQAREVSKWKRWLKKCGVENVRQSGIKYHTQ